MKPIRPEEVVAKKLQGIPDSVIEAFNEQIALAWNGTSAVVLQKAVVNSIMNKTLVSRSEVFNNGWLDIEEIYKAEGWEVEYDKPGYCETYEANFIFTPHRKKT